MNARTLFCAVCRNVHAGTCTPKVTGLTERDMAWLLSITWTPEAVRPQVDDSDKGPYDDYDGGAVVHVRQ